MVPYTDVGEFRTFSSSVNADELLWHWDEEDRTVTPVSKTDWQFQFDNETSFVMNEKSIFIKAGVWHRLIKGTGELSLHIIRHS